MSAASQARRLRSPDDLQILAFDKGNFTSYSGCGIPYVVGGVVGTADDLVVRSPERFRDKYSITARIRHEVTALDLDKGTVKVRDIDAGKETSEGFDNLVVATGAKPVELDLPGSDLNGIFGVQTLDDGIAIEHWLDRHKPQRAVIVGGGYIGLEMAEAFLNRGLETIIVEMAAQPMTTLDPDMGSVVAEKMQDVGIKVLTEEPVTGFEGKDGRLEAVVTEHQTLPAEIVVLGLGVVPNTDLAQQAGIPIGTARGVKVDRQMRTGIEGVWSAGDCAQKFHRVARRWVAIALGTHANKEGRVAGVNIGGGYATFPGVVGTSASRVCDLEIGRTGLNESEAHAEGFEYVTAVVDSITRAGYFPGKAPIKTKLVVEKRSGLLLGAQIVGLEGAAKRIDVLAAAVWNEMTADELINLDLAYAPPFSPVWDPVLIAARKASQQVQEAASE
jgi:NADPH-dependent 2,4-dienoyl-CoA reductase/sulfur reductase-like enzyme